MKCKLEGSTQAAHLGKGGGGIKAGDDTCAPLCTLHPDKKGNLVLGCHEKLDQYLETKYWDENLLRAKATVKQARQLWKLGKFEEAERLIREF